MNMVQRLTAARDRLSGRWLQGDLWDAGPGLDADGEGYGDRCTEVPDDWRVCAAGAVWVTIPDRHQHPRRTVNYLTQVAAELYPDRMSDHALCLADFNDHHDTTEADVLHVFDLAIAKAMEEAGAS